MCTVLLPPGVNPFEVKYIIPIKYIVSKWIPNAVINEDADKLQYILE
jgi:hypothetical protein